MRILASVTVVMCLLVGLNTDLTAQSKTYWEENNCWREMPPPELYSQKLMGYEFYIDGAKRAGIEKGIVPGSNIKIGIIGFGCDKAEMEIHVRVPTKLYPNLNMKSEAEVSKVALEMLSLVSDLGITANLLALCDEVYSLCLQDGHLLLPHQECHMYPKSPIDYMFYFGGVSQENKEYKFEYYYSKGPR